MKRLAWLLILVLFAVPAAWAQTLDNFNAVDSANIDAVNAVDDANIDAINAVDFALPAFCSSFTPGDPFDLFCEDTEGSNSVETGVDDWDNTQGTDAQWEQNVDQTGVDNTWNDQTHSSTLTCANYQVGSYAARMYVYKDSTGTENAYMRHTPAAGAASTYYLQFYLLIVSEAWEANEVMSIGEIESGGSRRIGVRLKNSGANIVVEARIYHSGAAYVTYACDACTNLNDGAWHRVGIQWEQNTVDGALVFIDGSEDLDMNGATTFDGTVNQIVLGSQQNESSNLETDGADAITVEYDQIGGDNDTMPGPC
jgi:hypothetical protein